MQWKLLEIVFDILMFVVPILEMSELMTLIPPEWLPFYMISTVVLRRVLRVLEDKFRVPTQTDLE